MLDYYIVPDCKREQLFDFYALTMFNPRSLNNEDDKDYFTRARESIIEHLRTSFISVLTDSLSCELWHIPRRTTEFYEIYYNPSASISKSWFTKYNNIINNTLSQKEIAFFKDIISPKRHNDGDIKYDRRIIIFKDHFKNSDDIASLAIRAFTGLKWPSDYGGKKWLSIANALEFLIRSRSLNDKMVAVDHAFDLQHNTNTAFNKTPEFAINGNYEWLKIALNQKFKMEEPHEILPRVSHQLRRPLSRVFKFLYNKTYESYLSEASARKMKKIHEYVNSLKRKGIYCDLLNNAFQQTAMYGEPYSIYVHTEWNDYKVRRFCRKEYHESNGWIEVQTINVEESINFVIEKIYDYITSNKYKKYIEEYIRRTHVKNRPIYIYYNVASNNPMIIKNQLSFGSGYNEYVFIEKLYPVPVTPPAESQTEINFKRIFNQRTETKESKDLEELPF